MDDPRFTLLCRMGDSALVLGHRLSELCGHGPMLEEDIATTNTALDLIGQATLWLGLAGETEGAGRNADMLAMHREAWDFRNLLLVEQPNRDFAHTIMRQMLFDLWHLRMLEGLTTSSLPDVAEVAAKAMMEVRYHAERSGDLVIRLGDGTPESHHRLQSALDRLYPFVGEMLCDDDVDHACANAGLTPLPSSLAESYHTALDAILAEATLQKPKSSQPRLGGKSGAMHSEHLGHMLAVMQSLPRAYPEAAW